MNSLNEQRHQPRISIEDTISHAFKNYKGVLGYAVVIFIIVFLLEQIFSLLISPISGFDMKQYIENLSEYFKNDPRFKVHIILAILVNTLLSPFYVGFIYIIHRFNTKQSFGFSDIMIGYNQNTGNIMLYHIISMVLIVIGFILCIIPGVILAIRLSVGRSIVFFENKSAIEAIKKSFSVTRGNFWPLLILGIASSLISVSGLLLCGVGIVLTALFMHSVTYSVYCTLCGIPKEINHEQNAQ